MTFLSEIITRESFVIEYGSHIKDAILIVLEGQFSFSVNGRQGTASQIDICVFQKDTLFTRKVLQKIRGVYIQFETFPVPLCSGLLETADAARTENTIGHLARAVVEKNTLLIAHFLKDILLLHKSPQAEPNPVDPMVASCIAYLSRHCGEYITLEILAERFSISKQGLITRFKKSTRKTPMQYLNFIRINQSKLLLRETALSVGDIAVQCGFENIYYFSNVFKRVTGVSPLCYRKEIDG